VGVGFQGGKIRLGGGEQFLNVLVHGGLVIFGRQQIVSPGFQHRRTGGIGLSVQGVQRDKPASQIHVLKELPCHRDFVGLGLYDCAGQIILAGHADGREHPLAAAMLGFFAVQDNQFGFGNWAAHVLLNGQDGLLEQGAIHLLLQAAEG
jgi:hypothetical protein